MIKYDEFDKSYEFEYKGKVYSIPPISQEMSEILVTLNAKARDLLDNGDLVGTNKNTLEYVMVAMAGLGGTKEEIEARKEDLRKELLKFSRPVLHKLMMVIMTDMHGYSETAIGEELDKTKKH